MNANYICLYAWLCSASFVIGVVCSWMKWWQLLKTKNHLIPPANESKEWNFMSRGRLKGDLPARCSIWLHLLLLERPTYHGNASQSNFMLLYNNVDIVWGFQNFLLHPFGYSNRIHWWKIFSSYIYENAQVQFIDSWKHWLPGKP